jgi:hypothetical protein
VKHARGHPAQNQPGVGRPLPARQEAGLAVLHGMGAHARRPAPEQTDSRPFGGPPGAASGPMPGAVPHAMPGAFPGAADGTPAGEWFRPARPDPGPEPGAAYGSATDEWFRPGPPVHDPEPEPVGADTMAIRAVLGDAGRTKEARHPGRAAAGALPLLAVLAAQVGLAVPLLRANTAFGDEALYLWTGHLEWAHWLHGAKIPAFQTWFSGAPVLYPPLGALADSVGGLFAARILSMVFMLGTTTLLWATANRLNGPRAAFFAAAVFVALGPTLKLSAFATYDPLALLLLALATWLVVAAPRKGDSARWIIAASLALVLANATKYASALFDPVVLAVAVLSAVPHIGWKAALRRGSLLTGCLVALIVILLRVGGSWYEVGIGSTTTLRAQGSQTPMMVLLDSWHWTAPVVVLAGLALFIQVVSRGTAASVLLTLALGGAVLLAPIEQARIHTTTSLDKHVDFGAWFAAIAAGYALASLAAWLRPRMARAVATVAVAACVVPLLVYGRTQSRALINWPNSTKLIAVLRPLTSHGGRFLAETSDVPEYYLPDTSWRQWSNTFSLTLPSGFAQFENNNPAPYVRALSHHYFTVVVLDFTDTISEDSVIAAYLNNDPSYQRVPVPRFPDQVQYRVWRYVGQQAR